jgi:LPPG:FO 2-phospho-L-lactate transferase
MLALAGGVGGAKLAEGFARLLGSKLTVIVNTGDDSEHLGLHISPDLDTVTYTLAGLANPETGWGLANETWSVFEQVRKLDGPSWFKLGDRDLATQLVRTHGLRHGQRLTMMVRQVCEKLSVPCSVLPMSDDPIRTIVLTAGGQLSFQHYFVELQCRVPVTGFEFHGAATARLSAEVGAALSDNTHEGIVFCPSNPFVSIDPILSVPGIRQSLSERKVPAIAVSPIIDGSAVKGPAAKMMAELGLEISPVSIARHYRGLIDGMVIDDLDAGVATRLEQTGVAVLVAPTLMKNEADRRQLAERCLAFIRAIGGRGQC